MRSKLSCFFHIRHDKFVDDIHRYILHVMQTRSNHQYLSAMSIKAKVEYSNYTRRRRRRKEKEKLEMVR